MKSEINVLSLFNGMSTGHTALDNLGIKVDKYYSSEIKKAAIELSQHHYPETIQLGDVNKWREWDIDWQSIDLLLSGSPCQDLSIAGSRAGLKGNRSSLFFVFTDILEHITKVNPKVLFLQENVGSAFKSDVGIMSRALGVYPVRINSNLVTAQLRDRYYWSNIRTIEEGMFGDLVTDIPQPKDRKIMFKDIIENGLNDNTQLPNLVYVKNEEVRVKTNTVDGYDVMTENDCLNLAFPDSTTRRGRVTKGKAPCLTKANEPLYSLQCKQINPSIEAGEQPHNQNRVYDPDFKMPCLTESFARRLKVKDYSVRILSKVELCRLQGFPDNWCDVISRNKAASLLGDGWTLPVIEHIFQYLPFNKSN